MAGKRVIVSLYDEGWKKDFEDIRAELAAALSGREVSIEHVGSTSVEGLSAKPVIDIDIVISDKNAFDGVKQALESIGYTHEGDLGIPGREAFKYEGKEHLRKHHLYVCTADAAELKRHISFRDYLRSHPEAVREYVRIKEEGAALYPDDIDSYIAHKAPFIEGIYKELGFVKSYSYILFDLDGTLTDSGPGIANAFAYAITKMGGTVDDRDSLRRFVGPPLTDSFGKGLGYSPEDTKKAIVFYREYYNEMGGNAENSVYPGIEKVLSKLKASGKKLIVATSKSERGTSFVLKHFGLDKYFDLVATADDEIRKRKADVIRYALEQCGITDLSQAVMVGDRENDVSAANEVGLDSIGVLYGYGDEVELTAAGATYLAEQPEDIMKFI